MNKFKRIVCLFGILIGSSESWGQSPVLIPELSISSLQPVNRSISILANGQWGTVVRVHPQQQAGVVWLREVRFDKGIIEFDVKGKDIPQESFVGMAFHGVNDSTYQAVYFRPFNFLATDPERKKHAVQYISLPDHDWPYLREIFPDQYEAAISHYVDPNAWVHVKIIVEDFLIKTFINSDEEPALVVQSLKPASLGKIGFWTGNGSDGDFANLSITASSTISTK